MNFKMKSFVWSRQMLGCLNHLWRAVASSSASGFHFPLSAAKNHLVFSINSVMYFSIQSTWLQLTSSLIPRYQVKIEWGTLTCLPRKQHNQLPVNVQQQNNADNSSWHLLLLPSGKVTCSHSSNSWKWHRLLACSGNTNMKKRKDGNRKA